MKISIFGTGYVGLVTGACLADVGHQVICVDIDPTKISNLSKGIIPIFEPGLEDIVRRNVEHERLSFTTDLALGVKSSEMLIIAVGTPPGENGSADLGYVLSVASTIGQFMDADKTVVNKSTVPVGTADAVAKVIRQALADRGVAHSFDVCSNPEFLKEGAAVEDFTKGPRIIVGTDSEHVKDVMRLCYAPFSRNHDKLIFMDVRSAELTKYAANALLATKITFMNEMSRFADALGADIEQVRVGIGSDPRIGYDFIYPGCGYGGSCFPKDVLALQRMGDDCGYQPLLVNAVHETNEKQKQRLIEMLIEQCGSLNGLTVAVWGLAFKPNTDDTRDAPSHVLIQALVKQGATVRAYDPKAMDEFKRAYDADMPITYCSGRYEATDQADVLVICTEWKEFRIVDTQRLANSLSRRVVVDGRNIFDPKEMADAGLTYRCIGRPVQTAVDKAVN